MTYIYVFFTECPAPGPGNLANGRVQGNGIVYRSTYHFTCNDGYVLYGHNIIRCIENGTWNGTIPSCLKGNKTYFVLCHRWWLGCLTLVRALGRVVLWCSWASHFTLTVPLSTQKNKAVTINSSQVNFCNLTMSLDYLQSVHYFLHPYPTATSMVLVTCKAHATYLVVTMVILSLARTFYTVLRKEVGMLVFLHVWEVTYFTAELNSYNSL